MNQKKYFMYFLTIGDAGFYFLLISAADMSNSPAAASVQSLLLSTLDLCVHFSVGHMIHDAKISLDAFCCSIPSPYNVSSS